METDVFQLIVTAMVFGISAFCALSLWLRFRTQAHGWPIALFFLVLALTLLPLLMSSLVSDTTNQRFEFSVEFLEVPLTLLLAPLFWLYVWALSQEDHPPFTPWLLLHLIPLGLVLPIYGLFLWLPVDEMQAISQGLNPETSAGLFVFSGFMFANVIFYLQIGAYLVPSLIALHRFRNRLKDLFASTEDREMRWLWGLTMTASLFWLSGVLRVLLVLSGVSWFEETTASLYVSAAFTVPFIWVLATWSLRQQPGLKRHLSPEVPQIVHNVETQGKYAKSALEETQAHRIREKIEKAMSQDLLYRNPNLSLWDLAQHIGVTSNYVSQTLNDTIGARFFDYINSWRIRAAVEQMRTSDATILIITYDAGFNSRSAFYRAFKREMKETPTEFRRRLGQ